MPFIDRDQRGRLRINKKEVAYAIFKNYSHFLDRLNKNVLFHDMINRHSKNVTRFPNQYSARYEIYNYINDNIIQNRSIDYLEFGVFKGDSIKHWASINSHRESRFFGFDTFEGLPEGHSNRPKGTFDVHGDIPEVDDERVTLEKGLFQDVLPIFLADFQPKSQVVIHIDTDLYSSTLYCLTSMNNMLKPGSILIFDEFGDLEQEFAAFYDYTRSYYRNWELICAQHNLWLVAMQLQ